MAIVRALSDGTIWQFFPLYPAGQSAMFDPAATVSLEFDESTNAALVADIQTNGGVYALTSAGGITQLQKNGAPVIINAANALYPLQPAILTGISEATLKAAIVALWSGTATAAQQQKALAYCLLKLHQAGVI